MTPVQIAATVRGLPAKGRPGVLGRDTVTWRHFTLWPRTADEIASREVLEAGIAAGGAQ